MASGVLILIRNGLGIRRPERFLFVLLVHYEKKAHIVNRGFTVFRWKSKGIFRNSSRPLPQFKSMSESTNFSVMELCPSQTVGDIRGENIVVRL